MPARSRRVWKPNARGYYERQIGWIRTKNGKLQQPKFLLGTDRAEAQRRERKLCEMWARAEQARQEKSPCGYVDLFKDELMEQTSHTERPEWPRDVLDVAKKVAKGISEVSVARKPNEMPRAYADRIHRLQQNYPVVVYVATDTDALKSGTESLKLTETLRTPVARKEFLRVMDSLLLDEKSPPMDATQASQTSEIATEEAIESPPAKDPPGRHIAKKAPSPPQKTATLHEALRTYKTWLGKEYFDHSLGRVSETYR